MHHDKAETDVLVVGGGVAGLYAAYRLLQREPGTDVTVVESLDRLGGRIDTSRVVIDGCEVAAEQGGMRFCDKHRELIALLGELDLSRDVDSFLGDGDNNVYYLRGVRFTEGDIRCGRSAWPRLFGVAPDGKEQSPRTIVAAVLEAILTENGVDLGRWHGSADDWTSFRLDCSHKGIEIYRWGLWSLLSDFGLRHQAIDLLYAAAGLIIPTDQFINAGSGLKALADCLEPTFLAIRGGYQQLPDELERRIRAAGGRIHVRHHVTAIEPRSDGRLEVDVRATEKHVVFVCSHLVLAIPPLALERLATHVQFMRANDRFMRDVRSCTQLALSKINLYYSEAWWARQRGIQGGGCYTDLPLGHVCCFVNRNDVHGPGYLTIYADHSRSNYWSELQALGLEYSSPIGPVLPSGTIAASEAVVQEANRQLREMFGMELIPDPLLATYKRWGEAPHGEGDHHWLVGVDDRAVRRRMAETFPRLTVCGESYSDDQGWVNGAIRSVDQMLAANYSVRT